MGMACIGLTHCEECGGSLGMDEFLLCSVCREEKESREKELEEKHRVEKLKSEIADMVKKDIKNSIDDIIKSTINKPVYSIPSISDIVEHTINNPVSNTPSKEIGVCIDKPKGMSFDEWYANIGHIILELSSKYDGVSIKFVSRGDEK